MGQPVSVDGLELAELLAERLHEVVPPDFAVVSRQGVVEIRRRDGSGDDMAASVGDIVDQPGDPLLHLVAACHRALTLVQGVVSRHTAQVWPGPVASSPRVAIEGRQIRLWFVRIGEPRSVLLELRPIFRT
jgi:hypothetical protein